MELQVKRISGDKAIAKNSRPPPIVHIFLDANGDPVDLSIGVWSGQFRAEQLHSETQPTDLGTGIVDVDVVEASATYNWVDEDFETIGRFRGIIWIGNGVQRYGSTVYEWEVADAPGADPSV